VLSSFVAVILPRLARTAGLLIALTLLAGCASTSASPASYSSLVLALHPTAYWKLDSASLTVIDSSGHSNNGSLSQAASLVAGPLHGSAAQALHFDGPQHIAVTHPIGLGASTSLELWVNYDLATAVHLLRASGTDPTGAYSFVEVSLSLPQGSQGHLFSVYDFPTATINATYPISAGGWHYLVLTNDGATDSLYQDGALVGTGLAAKAVLTPSTSATNPAIEIGAGGGKALANIAIYPLVLTPAQVQSHWHTGCSC
jgi:Concanavalin A-like lectin/glucanases superfamily